MAGFKKTFGNWWVLSILTAVLAVFIFVLLLPLVVGFLRPLSIRLIALVVIALIWGACALWRLLSARAAARRLEASLDAAEPDLETKALATRMRDALAKLKTATGDRRDYLYSRPWYVIIGPPGSGKTTALVNSGLRFPFSDEALSGIGGTRNLDFWFADEAVLVDTAGRYTSQDSDQARDRDAWRGFLDLLRKNRPLEPINGVLVAIGLDELAGADVATIDRHAATVRRRLSELQTGLEITVPVYVMFTKADLIAGFAEFYDDLDVEGRRAVLGATFPWQGPRRIDTQTITTAFDEMAQSLADRTSKRLQEELDARRRGLIVGFPAQIEALRSRVVRFLDGTFPIDAPETGADLRGFYLTSGVQQGTPLDRILAGVAAVYDAPVRPTGPGRAYFINRLLKDVVIGEAGLVQSAPKARARRATLMAVGFGVIGMLSLLVLIAWGVSFTQNRNLQNQLVAGGQNVSQQVKESGLDLVEVREGEPDLQTSLAVLRSLRTLPRGYAESAKHGPPLAMTFGLYQESDSRAASQAYQEALQRILLPRILLRLERYLQDNQTKPLAIYEPLKVYLMLGGQSPTLDKQAIKAWVQGDWSNLYPGEERSQMRAELGEHLDALLADPRFGRVWPDGRAPLDGALVQAARAEIQTLPLADRAYAILRQEAAASGGPDWRADAILGSGSAKAFANGDQVLAQTTPYFFTRVGFHKAYQGGLQTVQADLEKDLWVMGSDQNKDSIRAQIQTVKPEVARLYAQDYIRAWDQVIASMQPGAYFVDPAAFGAATGDPSPLKLILLEVRKNTSFSGGTAGVASAESKLPGSVRALMGGSPGAAGGLDAGQQISDHFKPIHAFVGDGKGPAPVDDFIAKLRAAVIAKGQADRMAGGLGGDAVQADLSKAMSELAAASATAPAQIQSFTAPASKQGDSAQLSSASAAITTAYAQTVQPACVSATDNRYPFVAASRYDVTIADMQHLFGQGGQVDAFAQTRLALLIDTASPVWRWRIDSPIAASLDGTSASEFQKAAAIHDLLTSGVVAKIEAVGFGGAVTAAEFSAGDQTYRFDTGQAGQRTFQWNTSALPVAHVTLFSDRTKLKDYTFEGPWAVFRLFDAASHRENSGPTAFKATFGDGVTTVTFRVTLTGATNPFSRGGLWSFRCPPKL